MKTNQNGYGNLGEKEGASEMELSKTEGLEHHLQRKSALSAG